MLLGRPQYSEGHAATWPQNGITGQEDVVWWRREGSKQRVGSDLKRTLGYDE